MTNLRALHERDKAVVSPATSDLQIPIIVCPECRKRPMTIKALMPRLLRKNGADVELFCMNCDTSIRQTVKPAD